METDFHLICEDSRQFDFLLGWTLFKELSMRNACDTAPLIFWQDVANSKDKENCYRSENWNGPGRESRKQPY